MKFNIRVKQFTWIDVTSKQKLLSGDKHIKYKNFIKKVIELHSYLVLGY